VIQCIILLFHGRGCSDFGHFPGFSAHFLCFMALSAIDCDQILVLQGLVLESDHLPVPLFLHMDVRTSSTDIIGFTGGMHPLNGRACSWEWVEHFLSIPEQPNPMDSADQN
jgi:hypothetical protein